MLISCFTPINPEYSLIIIIELRIEYFRSFSVVPPSEDFVSLFYMLPYLTIDKINRENTQSSVAFDCYICIRSMILKKETMAKISQRWILLIFVFAYLPMTLADDVRKISEKIVNGS
jgi:hypothetical protein